MIVKPVGIENVVNWQDNGVFADTQKPVADDNYTLAGDVNQDNLYVGYMKEHGLKGKLSLPVLSSLGTITGRQTIGDCEVYKHVNGTTIIKGAVINQNLPDSRISLGFSADENGLQYYNNPNDPMPIKTINMAGLQKWEETDDYIIYLDKDAIVTTVQNYVPGTFDLFLERKANIDGAIELLKENGIEWTAEDDSKLLQDINLAQLERIASMPTTMDESTEIQTFEARTIPTTYECCFRTDKKSGEIYIGEGYENLAKLRTDGHIRFLYNGTDYDCEFISSVNNTQDYRLTQTVSMEGNFVLSLHTKDCSKMIKYFYSNALDTTFGVNSNFEISKNLIAATTATALGVNIAEPNLIIGEKFKLFAQITKTSTPKPFVKSVMPSGKLSFVTNATSETHSFVMKGAKKTNGQTFLTAYNTSLSGTGSFERVHFVSNADDFKGNFIISNTTLLLDDAVCTILDKGKTGGVINMLRSSSDTYNTKDSFKQLLIYKGNLTEAELKAENEKVINVGAYYQQENSVPLIYGIDSMKAMRVYSPALTDAEIAEEVNKNIYIPQNRDGVPNYLGEVK